MKNIIIALDGYSGTGKSSTAKRVAERLGYTYIDSGAMYRAVTYHFLKNQIEISDLRAVEKSLAQCEIGFKDGSIHLNGVNVEAEIRTMEVSEQVSKVSAISMVRVKLVEQQRKMGAQKRVVMDGRDIGTVVFPKAELKLFMTANMEIRTERRRMQLEKKGLTETKQDIERNLIERDRIDSSREDSPLRMASDAVEIDTSHLTLNQQIDKIASLAEKIIYEG